MAKRKHRKTATVVTSNASWNRTSLRKNGAKTKLRLSMADYTLLICPVCLQQVECGWESGADCCHAELGGNVEAKALRTIWGKSLT